jgi:energy-coupling factor transporter ATP-binding protein EcfA2
MNTITSMDMMDLDLDLVIATVASGRPPTFVAIVGPPQSGKSSIVDLFKGILPRPTVRDGFIDHWNDTPCCKIIDTTVQLSATSASYTTHVQGGELCGTQFSSSHHEPRIISELSRGTV